jgi:hypothetical protein
MLRNKILSGIFFLTCWSEAGAQMEYTSYRMGLTGEEYKIEIGKEGKLYISMLSVDNLSKEAGIIVKPNKAQTLIECLDTSRKKLREWGKIARDNNIQEFRKEIDCRCKVEGFFSYGDWQFDYNVQLTFNFTMLKVGEEVYPVLMVRTGPMQSMSNQFISHDGATIVFEKDEEIVEFIRMINPKNVEVFMNKVENKENLFK